MNLFGMAFLNWLITTANTCGAAIADGFESRNISKIVWNVIHLLLMGLTILFLFVLLAYLIVKYWILLLIIAIVIESVNEWYKAQKKQKETPPPPPPPPYLEIEIARIRAREIYPFLLAFMFQVDCAVSQEGIIRRMGNPHDIETQAINGEHFYLQGVVPVFQFEVFAEEEITLELADTIRDDLQKTGENYIGEHVELISEDAVGRTPFEILRVQPLGKRACVEVVLTTAASIPLIDKTRRARIERQLRQKQNQGQADPFDPLF